MPLFLPSSPYFSSKKNLESGAAGGRRIARPSLGRETREKKRGAVWKEEKRRDEKRVCRRTSERNGSRNLLYRPTCRRCDFNGGSGVSRRIVRSRGGDVTERGHRE